MSRLTDRVARLEAGSPEREMAFVWRYAGETPEQAEARYRADHPENERCRLMLLSWMGG